MAALCELCQCVLGVCVSAELAGSNLAVLWEGVSRVLGTEPISKLPSFNSLTVMFALATLISRLRLEARADNELVTRD